MLLTKRLLFQVASLSQPKIESLMSSQSSQNPGKRKVPDWMNKSNTSYKRTSSKNKKLF